ncbi:MAG: hypothetical protein HY517_03855 [Candidatus Aenigmarchaeota archaeon]|nr:hypothetical protein [Candidatus Aenigmarchaeota archaeon]
MYEYPLFEGKPVIPTKDAQHEMDELGLDLWRVKEILEQGYDCSKSKRAKNIVERCLFRKNKEVRVVAALVEFDGGEFWRIIHVGKTGGHQ